MHSYDSEGTYTVTLRVHDNEGDTDTDTATVSIDPRGVDIEIGKIKGGLGTVSATIRNVGDTEAIDVEWSVEVWPLFPGLSLTPISLPKKGSIDILPSGESMTIHSGIVIGAGLGQVSVRETDSADYEHAYALLIILKSLPFLIIVINF